jgi:hypothetical protein
MTVAQNLNSRLDLNQAFFGPRDGKSARQQEAGDGLNVTTAEPSPGAELYRIRS